MVIMFSFVVVGWGLGKSRLLPDEDAFGLADKYIFPGNDLYVAG